MNAPAESHTVAQPGAFFFHRALLDDLPMLVWWADAEGNCSYYNKAFREFLGNEFATNVADGWHRAIHPEDREKCAQLFAQAVAGKGAFETEYRLRRKDGIYRWVLDRGTPYYVEGILVGFVGFCFDVTDQRGSDTALRESEEQIRLLTLATHDLVWSWDARSGRVIHNNAFSELLGVAPAPLQAALAWWRHRVHPEDREGVTRALHEAFHSGAPDVNCEYRIRRRNGSWIVVEDRACLMRDSEGRVVRVLGAMRDVSARKAAEQERERFVRILEATTDVVCMAHPNGDVIHLNAAGRKLLGWPPQGPLLEYNIGQCHPDWANEIVMKEAIPEAISEGAWSGESALQAADGREVPVLQVVLAHRASDGSVEFISTIMRDVSEHKRAEVARIEAANRYDAAIRSSRQLLFDWNSFTGDITYAGDVQNFLGFSSREMAGGLARFRQLVHQDDLQAFDDEISRVIATRDPFRLTFRARRKDASEVSIDAKGHFFLDRQGHFGRMVGFFADVTAERRAQETLTRAHEVLERRVAARTAELARANAVIEDRARQQEAVARLGQRALIGTPLSTLFQEAAAIVRETLHVGLCSVFELTEDQTELVIVGSVGWPEDKSSDRMPAGPFSQSGYTLQMKEPVIAEDLAHETRFPVSNAMRSVGARSAISVLVQTEGTPFGVLCATSLQSRTFTQDDVNFLQSVANVLSGAISRQRAEESVRQAREQAETANRAKSEFLSRMSHELRTPLNAIIGFTQLLELESLTPAQAESIAHISHGGSHLLALINQVLDIARIDTGRLALTLESVELGEALHEAVELIRPLAARHEISVALDAECGHGLHVNADRQRLKQVFLNLLSNAVKFNREHGEVTITAEAAGSSIFIRIRDTGPGIPAEKMNRLFVPFERLGAESTQIDGTGIGLALAQRIVLSLNGQLTAESEVGKGSTFCVELPIAAREIQESELPATIDFPSNGSTRPRTVLYIEDQDLNLRLVERIFKKQPHLRLIPAMQGSLGLELAREHHPDVIMLDLNLPDLGGDEILRRLKAEPELRDIPVIMVSGDALGDRINQLLAQGAFGYITKPYRIDDFLRTLDEAVAALPA
jgi:PAS domain S-box-containing protein